MPTAADTGSGVCKATEPSERRIAYIASLLIVKHRAVLTLSLKHRKLKHNLLKTGHFLSELILFILDSIYLIMHSLHSRIELIDLIESKLERFTERLVRILIESIRLHVRLSHLTSVSTRHEVVCHGLCWTRPTAAQHNMVDNVL